MISIEQVFALMVIFQIKHYICDFPLQTTYMVIGKSRPTWEFFFPLLLHAGIHAVGTFLVVIIFDPQLWWLMLIDLVAHFIMDRLKASPRFLGKFDDSKMRVFGIDQMVHHLTHVFIVYIMYLQSHA